MTDGNTDTTTPPAPPAPELATKNDLRVVHSRLQALENAVGRCLDRVELFVKSAVVPVVEKAATVVAGDVAGAAGAVLKEVADVADVVKRVCPYHLNLGPQANGCKFADCPTND